MTQQPLADVVDGRFELLSTLVDTSDEKVYLARDRELDLDVVVKVRAILDADVLNQLRREASMLMQVAPHAGLPVVRSDLAEGNRYYRISDYIAGEDLESVVVQKSGGLALSTVVDIIDQVADTIDHLHRHRPVVVHGDVKPQNLVMTESGRVVLVNPGAVIRVDENLERSGTPGFSAPEALASELLTPAADVYSLAAVAVYLLTGVVPKLGAAWPPDLAGGKFARLEGVLRCGLTWEPLGRPSSGSEFAQRLRTASQEDVPTGTVTLMLVDSHALRQRPPLTVKGTVVDDVEPLPQGSSVVVYSRVGDAADDALALSTHQNKSTALHAGDLGGWHGATLAQLVDEAVSLVAADAKGAVVCSPPVRMLLGADASFAFDPIARGFVMRGASADVGAQSAAVDLSSSSNRARTWIAARTNSPIAGRQHELARAEDAIESAQSSGTAAVVVAMGDSGIGKTRLLAEMASERQDRGDHLFVGRCSASSGAFEPWLDALGDDVFPFETGQIERDEEGWVDRHRFFSRIADALQELGGPVTLIFDDLQNIDGSSLALLTQLLDEMGARLVLIGGCRPEVDEAIRSRLTLQLDATMIEVGPLSPEAVWTMAQASGVELDDRATQDVYLLTGGNPFFCLQLFDHLTELPNQTFTADKLPAGVRDWILRRVNRLGPDVRHALAPAAVVGETFDVLTLAPLLGMSPLEVLASLDAATSARLLVEGDHPGQFRFLHALVSTALADTLSASRQALLHATVAEILEQHGDDLALLDEALHHWFEADRLGDPMRAAELAVEVATRATERLGHERAIQVLDRAITLLPFAAPGIHRQRVEARARVALGRARLLTAEPDEAMVQLYQGADLAESADDPGTLAEAALVASMNRRHGLDDPDLLGLLERASESCPSEPAVLPAMLHIRRARLLPWATPHQERRAMARLGLRDLANMDLVDRATVEVEVARACWGPDDAHERDVISTQHIDDAARQLRTGGSSRWTGVLIEALNHRSAARVQLGRLGDALADSAQAATIADTAGSTFLLSRVMMGQAMINVALGNYDESERLANDAVNISGRHNLRLVQMALGYSIARDRGQQREIAELEQQMDGLIGQNPLLMAGYALVHAEAGRLDDARRLLARLEEESPWPRNWLWLATTIAALECAVLVENHAMTQRYFAVLKRYSGQWALGGAELACWGPIDRVLGLAQSILGDREEARRLLTTALESAEREQAVPWISRCRAGLDAL